MATPSAPPATEPAPVDDTPAWARVLIDRLDRLEERQRHTAAAMPAFKPMVHTETRPKGIKSALADLQPGQQREGVSHQILVTIHGEKVSGQTLRDYPCRFAAGDAVRIDPSSAREGFPEGKTWGDVLATIPRNPEGYGTVTKIYWLTDSGEWKFSVTVPGLTGARPDGFLDHELLPA
jgi:hypothetical protein